MEQSDEITTNPVNTEAESDDAASPWPISSETIVVQSEHNFDDNFCAKKNDELNQNGLVLPDSQQYLDSLEKRLQKLQMENSGRETQAKKMLKALATKRDEQFLQLENHQNIPNSTPNENSDHLDAEQINDTNNESNKITSAITRSALIETLGKKMFPHLHSDDPEEYKRLLQHDVLALLLKKNDPPTNNGDGGDDHDVGEIPNETKETKE